MAGIQNKLLIGAIIVIHSEKEVSVVKITGNKKIFKNHPKLPYLTVWNFQGYHAAVIKEICGMKNKVEFPRVAKIK